MSILFRHVSAAIALSLLILLPVAGAVEAPGHLSKKELKTLIADAKTPEEHLKLAQYYRAEATRLTAKQQEHEEEAAEYFRDPARHPGPKYPTLGQHCRDLAYYYGKGAQSAQALAAAHEGMAAAIRGKDVQASVVTPDPHYARALVAPASGEKQCMAMTAEHSMAAMRAMDTELERKLATMNEASVGAKLAAMAAVIKELASQHKAMRLALVSMRSGTTDDSGGNATGSRRESADQCPMVKTTGGSR